MFPLLNKAANVSECSTSSCNSSLINEFDGLLSNIFWDLNCWNPASMCSSEGRVINSITNDTIWVYLNFNITVKLQLAKEMANNLTSCFTQKKNVEDEFTAWIGNLSFGIPQSMSTGTISSALNELEYDAIVFQRSYDSYLMGDLTTVDLIQVFLGQPAAVASLNIDTGLSTIEQNAIDILLTTISSLQLSTQQAYETMLSYMNLF